MAVVAKATVYVHELPSIDLACVELLFAILGVDVAVGMAIPATWSLD